MSSAATLNIARPQRAASSAPPLPVLAQLLDCLAELHTCLKQLATLAGEKLVALRTANSAALEQCALREEELVKEVLARQQARDAVLARLAQSLPPDALRTGGLTALADRLPEPLASTLRARSVALRDLAADLQRKNRIVAAVAQKLHSHIRGIFADVAKTAQESVVYGSRGKPELTRPRSWVDAVG